MLAQKKKKILEYNTKKITHKHQTLPGKISIPIQIRMFKSYEGELERSQSVCCSGTGTLGKRKSLIFSPVVKRKSERIAHSGLTMELLSLDSSGEMGCNVPSYVNAN